MFKDFTDVVAILTKRMLGYNKQEAFLPPHTIPIQMIQEEPDLDIEQNKIWVCLVTEI